MENYVAKIPWKGFVHVNHDENVQNVLEYDRICTRAGWWSATITCRGHNKAQGTTIAGTIILHMYMYMCTCVPSI